MNSEMCLLTSPDIKLRRKSYPDSGHPACLWSETEYTIVGEVSTANDDVSDNFFRNPDIGRFSEIVEDEEPIVRLVSE